MTAERRLSELRAPDERGAEERAWAVVRTAYSERTPVPRQRSPWRYAVTAVALLIAALLALTPAGAAVRRWINQTLGVPRATPALFSLPAAGHLLVAGPGGTWTVATDGAKRRLGSWQDASWSPRGLYVTVTAANELAAVDLRGTPRWTLARPAVRYPRWFAPTGYRVAYLSGTTLRVVAGDGTFDRLLARRVAQTAPAWRAGHPYQLAYATASGGIVVRDADSGRVLWSRREVAHPRVVSWSQDGSRLLVLGDSTARVLDGNGRLVKVLALSGSAPSANASLSPDGHTLALLRAASGEVVLFDLAPGTHGPRRVFAGTGVRDLAWSPDGRWLVVTWPAADQWIFIHVTGSPRVLAVSHINEQFATGGVGFPHVEGWCCTAAGSTG